MPAHNEKVCLTRPIVAAKAPRFSGHAGGFFAAEIGAAATSAVARRFAGTMEITRTDATVADGLAIGARETFARRERAAWSDAARCLRDFPSPADALGDRFGALVGAFTVRATFIISAY